MHAWKLLWLQRILLFILWRSCSCMFNHTELMWWSTISYIISWVSKYSRNWKGSMVKHNEWTSLIELANNEEIGKVDLSEINGSFKRSSRENKYWNPYLISTICMYSCNLTLFNGSNMMISGCLSIVDSKFQNCRPPVMHS